MADLTEQNIREIEVLVEARGVEMKELSYDLVDHICCMIETKMESGKNYTSALEESIASFGKKGIRQIQEETTFRQVPCLTLRENTERPSTITLGTNELVKYNFEAVAAKINEIENGTFKTGTIPPNWDGKATQRIVAVLRNELN